MMKIIFWLSALIIFYTYIGYPIVIALWARLRARAVTRSEYTPRISIVIAAYNEEAHIAAKLASCFALDYPASLLEIIIASDGSTDNTDEIVRAHTIENNNLTLLRIPHAGKAAALNAAIAKVRGDIVIFTDARQPLDGNVARRLAANFADQSVGAVSGELVFIDEADRPHMGGVGLYWRYEKWLRRAEARVHSICGATGALYAIRRELLAPLPAGLILDDVLIPMRAVLAGYRIAFDGSAYAYDRIAADTDAEFVRKVRTLYGNYQLLALEPRLLSMRANPIFLQFFSHKICRLLAAPALVALLLSNLFLTEGLYLLLLAAQLGWYLLALCGWLITTPSKPAGKAANLHTMGETQ